MRVWARLIGKQERASCPKVEVAARQVGLIVRSEVIEDSSCWAQLEERVAVVLATGHVRVEGTVSSNQEYVSCTVDCGPIVAVPNAGAGGVRARVERHHLLQAGC